MAAILIAGHGALQEFPPISWSCPMHPDVVDDRPGRCPVCNMALEPVRLDRVWSCPVHAAVTRSNPGRCPICQRELMPVTMSLSWTCPEQPAVRQLEPGVCPSGL